MNTWQAPSPTSALAAALFTAATDAPQAVADALLAAAAPSLATTAVRADARPPAPTPDAALSCVIGSPVHLAGAVTTAIADPDALAVIARRDRRVAVRKVLLTHPHLDPTDRALLVEWALEHNHVERIAENPAGATASGPVTAWLRLLMERTGDPGVDRTILAVIPWLRDPGDLDAVLTFAADRRVPPSVALAARRLAVSAAVADGDRCCGHDPARLWMDLPAAYADAHTTNLVSDLTMMGDRTTVGTTGLRFLALVCDPPAGTRLASVTDDAATVACTDPTVAAWSATVFAAAGSLDAQVAALAAHPNLTVPAAAIAVGALSVAAIRALTEACADRDIPDGGDPVAFEAVLGAHRILPDPELLAILAPRLRPGQLRSLRAHTQRPDTVELARLAAAHPPLRDSFASAGLLPPRPRRGDDRVAQERLGALTPLLHDPARVSYARHNLARLLADAALPAGTVENILVAAGASVVRRWIAREFAATNPPLPATVANLAAGGHLDDPDIAVLVLGDPILCPTRYALEIVDRLGRLGRFDEATLHQLACHHHVPADRLELWLRERPLRVWPWLTGQWTANPPGDDCWELVGSFWEDTGPLVDTIARCLVVPGSPTPPAATADLPGLVTALANALAPRLEVTPLPWLWDALWSSVARHGDATDPQVWATVLALAGDWALGVNDLAELAAQL